MQIPKSCCRITGISFLDSAAKYPRGLVWCVYDVKFRQKAAINKSLNWSVIDSQLWLKTFTVAPSLMKEDIGIFQSGPSSTPSTVRGNEYRTCHNFNKGFSCTRTPCPYPHKCNKRGCRQDHPGIRCPNSSEPDQQPVPKGREIPQRATWLRDLPPWQIVMGALSPL